MSLTVNQIISLLNQIAPPILAESWDNIGLQIGNLESKVNKIWTALDPHISTIERACAENVDLLITHHPLFFNGLSRIDFNTTKGQIINLAFKKKLSICCAHTNFDNTLGGINDVLANKIGLIEIEVMRKKFLSNLCKLVVFTPMKSEKDILEALFSAGAGKIGTYSCCSFKNKGIGTFLPEKKSNPHIGVFGSISEVEEIRIESVVNKENINDIINSISKFHPYEVIPYDVYPLITNFKSGIGRIGKLKTKTTLYNFAKKIKNKLNLKTIKVSGNLDSTIEIISLCSGNGSSNLENFFESKAQVYVSGDISYHNARDAQDKGLATIDIGHFYSEKIAISNLTKKIKKLTNEIDKDIAISEVNFESDVFEFI